MNRLKRCALRWPLQARLRHKHIKWAKRRELLKYTIKRTRRASTTCGGIDNQECSERLSRLQLPHQGLYAIGINAMRLCTCQP